MTMPRFSFPVAASLCLCAASCKPRHVASDTRSIEALKSAGAQHGEYALGCGNARNEVARQNPDEAFRASFAALPPMFKFFFTDANYRLQSASDVARTCSAALKEASAAGALETQTTALEACWVLEETRLGDPASRVPVVYLERSPKAIHARLVATTAAAFDEYYVRGFEKGALQVEPEIREEVGRAFRNLSFERRQLADVVWGEFDEVTRNRLSATFPLEETRRTFVFAETVDAIYCSRLSHERLGEGAPRTADFVQRPGGIVSLLGSPWWSQ